MPIKIEITGEHIGDIRLALDALNAPDARLLPLTDLWKITQERFGVAGFVVTATAQGDVAGTPVPPPEEKVAAIEKALEQTDAGDSEEVNVLPAPKRKKTTTVKKPVPVKAEAPVSDADRAFVLDELTKRFADPRQKTQAKAFIDKIAGRHGGVRLSRLEPELFPQIREEMVVEFGLAGSNGHAAP